ncbi:MAG TPA: hypothetical protein VHB21_25540 [Minicystis sp.]|nr:hypothetical protein [Minicystis sp.]
MPAAKQTPGRWAVLFIFGGIVLAFAGGAYLVTRFRDEAHPPVPASSVGAPPAAVTR